MSNLSIVDDFTNKFSDNVLSKGSAFLDTDMTVNIVSGLGAVYTNIENAGSLDYGFEVQNNAFDTTDMVFNFGDNLKTDIYLKGDYIFQISIKDEETVPYSFAVFNFEVLVYKDGVYTESLNGLFDVDQATYDGKWVTFTQSISFPDVAEVDFVFKIIHNPLSPVTVNIFKMGNIKLELNDKLLSLPTPYNLPKSIFSKTSDLYVSETQWDVPTITPTTITNGSSLNLFTLINNITHKNEINTDIFDELNIVSNSIKTTYRGCKIIHTIRLSFDISIGYEQFYQLQIRRTLDNSVVYRLPIHRNPDETTQTAEMTTRTLYSTDPFVVDGFYLALVNNSGVSCELSGSLGLLIISQYQKAQIQ